MDVTATALAAAGVTVEGAGQDGINLMPLLTNDKAPDRPRTFYWRAGTRAAMRQGDWKIVRDGARGRLGQWQLFNLAADIAEVTDLAAQEPERLKTLVARWEKWSATQVEPAW
jgi:arylsulfatase A-like enzyme